MKPLKTIHIGLSPNNTWKDTLKAFWLLLPWNIFWWQQGKNRKKLEKTFREKFNFKFSYAVGSGREALFIILKSLKNLFNWQDDSEVVIQSFTCMVVVNSIVWNKLKPKYVDINDSYNFSLEELQKKVTKKTVAVVIQHTFGIFSEDIKKIAQFCKEKNLILIEDCAHSLGAKYQNQFLGSFGDFSFFSLGRSKVISSISGGMIAGNSKQFEDVLNKELEQVNEMSYLKIMQNLWHPIISSFAKLFYFSFIGKGIMFLSQKIGLLNMEVSQEEKMGIRPHNFPTKLSNAMCDLALIQLAFLDKFNKRREKIAQIYDQNLQIKNKLSVQKYLGSIWLRYPIQIKNVNEVIVQARKQGIYLGDWYSSPIAPKDINNNSTFYTSGEALNCENINQKILNLPTFPKLKSKEINKIIKIVNQYAEN